ncbi:putative hydrolase (HD superfamily) [Algoriphagus zhangzhouensis]|uniref:Predicted hydrolase, HD superfamily n=2 Tax=Algoriphagus zhangzhouensis TaxID=1073327 RepID=A0A1M7ZDF6_9BACT|nr:putative hydrolase (HD superfamily) [Algoriphagus zhangzhouensis]SHO62928.1 Predicted hydrolase, HD superfamily [Algoriphagus zhangzhouensis]
MNFESMKLNRDRFGKDEDYGKVIPEDEAFELLNDWVKNEKLIAHMKQVAHLMAAFAETKGLSESDQYRWYLAGLLHDADWEKWPESHCRLIIEELESRGVDPEIIRAIASHGPKYFGVEPKSDMDKMLYAFDELSGLIHAYSLMRPEGYVGMNVKGVKKRLKDKSFAAQVSREDISDAANRAGISLDELIQFVVINQIDTRDKFLL